MENWKSLIHLFGVVFLWYFAMMVVYPVLADVTMEAVCPGKDECSLAIYLTGLQQAVSGLGAVMMMPLIGKLSDVYGRKSLLTIPMILTVLPFAILAFKRTTHFFYVYYVLKTLTGMVSDSGVICLSLGYLADNVTEEKRVSAFGILAGVVSASTLSGTLCARLLHTAQIFQVATVASIAAALYMRIFLKDDKTRVVDALEEPILEPDSETTQPGMEPLMKKIPLPGDIIRVLRTSITLSLAAFVSFFITISEAGNASFLMYYLKARFQFKKDQYADVCLISYTGGTISQMVLVPILGPLMGEETLLCISLLAGFLQMLLDSIAWSSSVPYASALFSILVFLGTPSLRCIISKQVGRHEQGIAQGSIMGVTSFASVVSPLIYSPLSALSLSEKAPFNFPGFSILCVGLASLVGFILSTMIKLRSVMSRGKPCDDNLVLA